MPSSILLIASLKTSITNLWDTISHAQISWFTFVWHPYLVPAVSIIGFAFKLIIWPGRVHSFLYWCFENGILTGLLLFTVGVGVCVLTVVHDEAMPGQLIVLHCKVVGQPLQKRPCTVCFRFFHFYSMWYGSLLNLSLHNTQVTYSTNNLKFRISLKKIWICGEQFAVKIDLTSSLILWDRPSSHEYGSRSEWKI